MIEKRTYLLLAPWLLIAAMLTSCSEGSNEPAYVDQAKVISEYNDWSVAAFKSLCADAKGENVLFSPCSAISNLMMIADGTDAATKQGIIKRLFPLTGQSGMDYISTCYRNNDSNIESSIWIDSRSSNFDKGLFKRCTELLNTDVFSEDLASRSGKWNVDRWIKDALGDMAVESVLDSYSAPDLIYASTFLNNTYMDVALRVRGAYNRSSGESVSMDMSVFPHEADIFTGSGMDYKIIQHYSILSSNISNRTLNYIHIYLPVESSDLEHVIDNFVYIPIVSDTKILSELKDSKGTGLGTYRVEHSPVAIPAVRVENQIDLGVIYKSLGLDNLHLAALGSGVSLDGNKQSNIFAPSDRNGWIASSQMLSGIGMEGEACAPRVSVSAKATEPLPEGVIAIDRPFIFVVRQECTGAILFMGKIEHLD
ncbi:MAG: serpin family protein [Muribaculaceae bacterium]|nr:serpin family protein [Muribaculaceae bacterium]